MFIHAERLPVFGHISPITGIALVTLLITANEQRTVRNTHNAQFVVDKHINNDEEKHAAIQNYEILRALDSLEMLWKEGVFHSHTPLPPHTHTHTHTHTHSVSL